MEKKEVKRIKISAYNHAWQIENKIYAIGNLKLPVPISITEVAYFGIIAAVILVLSILIKPLAYIPAIIRFAIFPFLLTKFLLKKKLDGKAPQKYFMGWLQYLATKNDYIERFSTVSKNKNKSVKIRWQCNRGNSRVLFPDTPPKPKIKFIKRIKKKGQNYESGEVCFYEVSTDKYDDKEVKRVRMSN